MAGFDKFGVGRCCCGCVIIDSNQLTNNSIPKYLNITPENSVYMGGEEDYIYEGHLAMPVGVTVLEIKQKAKSAAACRINIRSNLYEVSGPNVIEITFYGQAEGEVGAYKIVAEYHKTEDPDREYFIKYYIYYAGARVKTIEYDCDGNLMFNREMLQLYVLKREDGKYVFGYKDANTNIKSGVIATFDNSPEKNYIVIKTNFQTSKYMTLECSNVVTTGGDYYDECNVTTDCPNMMNGNWNDDLPLSLSFSGFNDLPSTNPAHPAYDADLPAELIPDVPLSEFNNVEINSNCYRLCNVIFRNGPRIQYPRIFYDDLNVGTTGEYFGLDNIYNINGMLVVSENGNLFRFTYTINQYDHNQIIYYGFFADIPKNAWNKFDYQDINELILYPDTNSINLYGANARITIHTRGTTFPVSVMGPCSIVNRPQYYTVTASNVENNRGCVFPELMILRPDTEFTEWDCRDVEILFTGKYSCTINSENDQDVTVCIDRKKIEIIGIGVPTSAREFQPFYINGQTTIEVWEYSTPDAGWGEHYFDLTITPGPLLINEV